jgi:hypothetical protein
MPKRGGMEVAAASACNDFSQAAFLRGTDSPPSLSLTAESPEKTTEKKLVNVIST